jgi:type VI secretion system secreted protein Hcp
MAVDYFLKIDGVDGESQDQKHKGEIQVESWSWGVSQTGTSAHGSGLGAGRATFQDFSIMKHVDKASPHLMLKCATGEHIKKAVMIARKAGKDQMEYLKITFQDLLVPSYHTTGSGDIPQESVSLNFSKVEYEYKEQKADGSLGGAVTKSYDLKQQKYG